MGAREDAQRAAEAIKTLEGQGFAVIEDSYYRRLLQAYRLVQRYDLTSLIKEAEPHGPPPPP